MSRLDIVKDKKCAIFTHKSPDGDCLGSAYAMSNYLKRHQVAHHVLTDEVIPDNYLFLKTDKFISASDADDSYDMAIILDTSNMDRVANNELLDRCKEKMVIDHHKTNKAFCDYNIIEILSSTGELLYNLFVEDHYQIDIEDAKGLYTALVTDTGNFKYDSVTSNSFIMASELVKTGLDFSSINQEIYDNDAIEKVRLVSKSISDIKIIDHLAITVVTQDMLKEYGCQMHHSDGIVEKARAIKGVEIAVLIKEIDSENVKISMRSKLDYDVTPLCMKYHGGGHKKAGGFSFKGTVKEAEEMLIKEVLGK